MDPPPARRESAPSRLVNQPLPKPACSASGENLVRAEGLEPPRLSSLEPKSSASTSFATPAPAQIGLLRIYKDSGARDASPLDQAGRSAAAPGARQWASRSPSTTQATPSSSTTV